MRIFIVFFIVVSAVIAIFKDSHPEVTFIAQMMGVSWGTIISPPTIATTPELIDDLNM